MEMEVLVPSRNMDDRFDFNSARSSPMGSPRSPRGFGDFYCSAPTSPNRLAEFYREFDEFLISGDGGRSGGDSDPVSAPKSDEFAFDIGGGGDVWDTASLSAAELFDGGVIKPMTPQPMAAAGKSRKSGFMPPKSPVSLGKRLISSALSPRGKSKTEYERLRSLETENSPERRQRGRDRAPATARQPSRRETRSLSPLRVSQYPWEEEEDKKAEQPSSSSSSSSVIVKPPAPATATSSASAKSALTSLSKKWRLKDFFLFRSASEGRAADKDPLKKYTAAYNSSTRNSGSFPDSPRKTRGRVSAHELHYKTNKAVSDDMKKKTFLPYKQGILGRLAFNPAVNALANGFGLSHKK